MMTTFTVDTKDYPTPLELAEAGYRGYAEKTGGKTFDGRDMPEWKDLPERTMQAWVAAVVAIQAESARGTVHLSEPSVVAPGAAPVQTVTLQNMTMVDGVLVHGDADCWCGRPSRKRASVTAANLGEVHQLDVPGESESA